MILFFCIEPYKSNISSHIFLSHCSNLFDSLGQPGVNNYSTTKRDFCKSRRERLLGILTSLMGLEPQTVVSLGRGLEMTLGLGDRRHDPAVPGSFLQNDGWPT